MTNENICCGGGESAGPCIVNGKIKIRKMLVEVYLDEQYAYEIVTDEFLDEEGIYSSKIIKKEEIFVTKDKAEKLGVYIDELEE